MICVVDRIEKGDAVILVKEGGRMQLPLSVLPEGTGEGTVLRMRVSIDRGEEDRRRKEVRDLQNRLRDS